MNLYSFAITLNDQASGKFKTLVATTKAGTTVMGSNIASLSSKLDSLKEQRKLSIDKKDIVRLNNEIAQTSKELSKLENLGLKKSLKDNFREATQSSTLLGSSLGMLANPITGIVAGVVGISAAFGKGISDVAMVSDKLADVRKTTNMTEQAAQKFQNTLQQINTRTDLSGLLEIAKIGGSIGVAESEMLGFTKTIDQAAIALGDEFNGGIEAVAKNLGTLKDLFKDTKGLKYDEAMSRIGSSINHLGSISNGTGGNIADFTKKMGQLGTLAPKLTDSMALGATLESLGIDADIAGGGITNILTTVGKELPNFAKQLGVSEVKMKDMLNADPTAVLVNFAKSLKGLKNTEAVAVLDKLKIGSQESQKAILALANNSEMFTKLQAESAKAYAENTSLSAEFAIKNNTLAAKIDKAKNSLFNMSLALGGIVAPAVEKVSNLIATLVGDGNTIIGVLKGMAIGAGVGGVAYLGYSFIVNGVSSTLKLATLAQYAMNLAMSLNPVGLVIGAFALLGAGVAYAYGKFEGFRGLIWGVWEAMGAIVEKATLFGQTIKAMVSGDFEKAMSLNAKSNSITVGGAFEKGKQKGIADFKTENPQEQTQKLSAENQKILIGGSALMPFNIGENAKIPTNKTPSFLDTSLGNTSSGRLLGDSEKTKGSTKSGLGSGISEIKSDAGTARNLTINIDRLVETLNINTQNLQEGAGRIKEEITKILLSATNDVNLAV